MKVNIGEQKQMPLKERTFIRAEILKYHSRGYDEQTIANILTQEHNYVRSTNGKPADYYFVKNQLNYTLKKLKKVNKPNPVQKVTQKVTQKITKNVIQPPDSLQLKFVENIVIQKGLDDTQRVNMIKGLLKI